MSGDEGPNDLRLLLACINMTSVIGHELLSNNNIALLTEGDRPSHSFYKHGPPDGGRLTIAFLSINMAPNGGPQQQHFGTQPA
jgi:hypothetical protein